ncbi:MAG TPA: HAD family hydrolase [Saprospiraceae bacterium]|nr:HAD family hydrolase [Saprospiraceae bacterium]
MANKASILHLCDFDGTLTTSDSLLHFLWFASGPGQWLRALVLVPCYFTGLLLQGKWSNARAKEGLLRIFFKGKARQELEAIGVAFCWEKLPGITRRALLDTLKAAADRGEQVVIVSASPEIWLAPFCREAGFALLCTELAYQQTGVFPHETPRFTGYFATPNCNGAEKARRILEAYSLADFSHIIAYGNSRGDEAMFGLAHEVVRY